MACTSLGSVSESARTWYSRVGTLTLFAHSCGTPLSKPDARTQPYVGVESIEVGGEAHDAEAALDD